MSTGRHKSGGRITRIINCYCNLVDREGRGSLRCCKPLSGIKKSQFFAETADHYARCSAVTRGLKEKCAAKPEEHRGNALFALPDPFYLQSFSRNVTAT